MARPHDAITSAWSRCGSALTSVLTRSGSAIASTYTRCGSALSSAWRESGTVEAATVFINDLMESASAVLLSAHVGDSGVTWALHPSYTSTSVVEANIGSLSGRTTNPGPGTSSAYISDVASSPDTDDYRVIIGILALTVDRNDVGVVARFDPAVNNGVLFHYNRTASPARLEVYNLLAGTLLFSSNQALTIGVEHEVELRVQGNKAKLFFDGVERTAVGGVTVAVLTGRRVGPRFFQFFDSSPVLGIHITRLRVEDVAA